MTAEERARAEAVFVRVMQVMTSNRGVETIADALADARRGALEEAAALADKWDETEGTDNNDYRTLANRIRALADHPHGSEEK